MLTITGEKQKSIIFIPARLNSKRLPRKPLLEAGGKSLVQWTYQRAKQAGADYVIVVTPDQEIAHHCRMHDMTWWPSQKDQPTGTHRCAEALTHFKPEVKVGAVVNWQVDEPLVDPKDVNRLIAVVSSPICSIATLVSMVANESRFSPNLIKVAVSRAGQCLWFSRAAMAGCCFHCGVYAFHPNELKTLGNYQPSRLSIEESLEQLTWIENYHRIEAVLTEELPRSINTEEDWAVFKEGIERQQAQGVVL